MTEQLKQVQEQYETFSAGLQEKMDLMQKQYEEQVRDLQSQLQNAKIQSVMQEREEDLPTDATVTKQLQLQAEQIQTLKVGIFPRFTLEGIKYKGGTSRRADVLCREIVTKVIAVYYLDTYLFVTITAIRLILLILVHFLYVT